MNRTHSNTSTHQNKIFLLFVALFVLIVLLVFVFDSASWLEVLSFSWPSQYKAGSDSSTVAVTPCRISGILLFFSLDLFSFLFARVYREFTVASVKCISIEAVGLAGFSLSTQAFLEEVSLLGRSHHHSDLPFKISRLQLLCIPYPK